MWHRNGIDHVQITATEYDCPACGGGREANSCRCASRHKD